MKKKNFFAQYKQFTFFLILAVVIILIAVFAPGCGSAERKLG